MGTDPLDQEDLRLGHEAVDAEHGVQLQLVDSLLVELGKDGQRGAAQELLERLLLFTDMHFGSEELLMRLHAYPRYGEHVEEHRRLLERLRDLEARVREREASRLLADELRRWLQAHIAAWDRDFVDHAGEDGPAQAS